ncbi:MAG: hypothetical protein KBC64_01115 [Simkaniaceae bacterium]|nr:hypothetical protein [Simkaniaceae bacterium]
MLRELISTLLLRKEEVSIAEFYLLEQRSVESPLEKGQCALLRRLLGLQEFPLSAQKERGSMKELEQSLIFACLGDTKLLLELVSLYLQTIRDDEVNIYALGIAEKEFDIPYFFALLSLLFLIGYKITGKQRLGLLADQCFERGKGAFSSYLEALREYLLPRTSFQEVSLNTNSKRKITHHASSLSCVLTCEGISSGFGSIYKKHGKILTFGPCFFPLGIADHFGIFRQEDSFEDLFFQENPFHFSGWARAAHQGKATDLWTYVDISLKEQTVQLKVKFNACADFIPCAFVFFIEAEKGVVNGKYTLKPGTLDRYQEGSAPVVFGNQDLIIKPLFQSEMQLIPLGGASHYWGANFLLAFAITSDMKTYSFEIN